MNDLEHITRHVTRESRDPVWWGFAAACGVCEALLLVFALPIVLLNLWDDWRYDRWAERTMKR